MAARNASVSASLYVDCCRRVHRCLAHVAPVTSPESTQGPKQGEVCLPVARVHATTDWSAHELGSPSRWPARLKAAFDICRESRFPIVIFWGPEFVQLYNDAYGAILGASKHPATFGRPARECWPEVWDRVGPRLASVLETGRATWSDDLHLPLGRDGSIEDRFFTFSDSAIRDETGVRGVFSVVSETTARVLREREARERAEALAELDRAKTAFFANVSHEFRTPLTLMLGPLEQMIGNVPEGWREPLEMTRRNALRLGRLVNNLLDFTRLEQGRSEVGYESTDIVEYTSELASVFRSAIESAGLRLVLSGPSRASAYVDRTMWETIVFNLISNALKFTFAGEIEVAIAATSRGVEMRVRDTGIGIAQDDIPRLFERFHRVRSVRSRTHEGSGIGLALVRELVHLHGGSIEVASALGAGTTFTVVLPHGSDHLPQDRVGAPFRPQALEGRREEVAHEIESWAPSESLRPANDALDRPRIIVADDNADLRTYLRTLLERHYDVEAVGDGISALAALERRRADLIICDVMMPQVDGLEVVRRLRADESTSRIPVILLSARAGDDAAALGLGLGADDYLLKPFSAAELHARVASHLKMGQLRNGAVLTAEATRDAEHARAHHLRFLSEASDVVLTSIREPDDILTAIAATAVPLFVEWCGVYRRADAATFEIVAIEHEDPELASLARRMHDEYPLRSTGAVAKVIATGEPLRFDDVTSAARRSVAEDERQLAYLEALALRSIMIFPLSAFGEAIGAITLATSSTGRVLDDDDFAVGSVFAKRVSMAYENALLYGREHRVSEAMQAASLPRELPDVPGLQLNAVYVPGRSEAQIGGDWYDAFRLRDGRIVVSIGDVAGCGLDAAITMGNMRQIIRGTAQVRADPVLMLNAADRALRLEDPNRFVTAFVGVFDPVTSELIYASAGHPPPYVRHADGRLEELTFIDPPLGLRHRSGSRPKMVHLPERSLVVFYTDGLTEWSRDLGEGIAALEAALGDEAILASGDPATALESALLPQGARDDVAILTLRVEAQSVRPGVRRWRIEDIDGAALHVLRRELRAVLEAAKFGTGNIESAELVLGELVGNVVRYAPGPVDVALDTSGGTPVLHVIDAGPGFERTPMLPTEVLSESGRGLFIVAALTEEFNVSRRTDRGSHARAVLARTGR
jgi:signal transduction histidine kinase/DNA-binding response OmpR family regulator